MDSFIIASGVAQVVSVFSFFLVPKQFERSTCHYKRTQCERMGKGWALTLARKFASNDRSPLMPVRITDLRWEFLLTSHVPVPLNFKLD